MNERDLLQAGFRYALALTSHQQDAEDLVQEAWLRLHRRNGAAWNKSLLFTAIRNLFIDGRRRVKLIVLEPIEETQIGSQENFLVQRDGDGVKGMTLGDLEKLLAILRPEEREALFLNAVEGYTAREIAALNGCSRGTVLSLIHRGRQKLMKAMAGLSDEKPASML